MSPAYAAPAALLPENSSETPAQNSSASPARRSSTQSPPPEISPAASLSQTEQPKQSAPLAQVQPSPRARSPRATCSPAARPAPFVVPNSQSRVATSSASHYEQRVPSQPS